MRLSKICNTAAILFVVVASPVVGRDKPYPSRNSTKPPDYSPKPGDTIVYPMEKDDRESVPPLEGLDISDSKVIAEYMTDTSLKFIVKGFEKSHVVPKGHVIRQTPKGRKLVHPATEVHLILSSGSY